MTRFSRLALAATLFGSLAMPAFAQSGSVTPIPDAKAKSAHAIAPRASSGVHRASATTTDATVKPTVDAKKNATVKPVAGAKPAEAAKAPEAVKSADTAKAAKTPAVQPVPTKTN